MERQTLYTFTRSAQNPKICSFEWKVCAALHIQVSTYRTCWMSFARPWKLKNQYYTRDMLIIKGIIGALCKVCATTHKAHHVEDDAPPPPPPIIARRPAQQSPDVPDVKPNTDVKPVIPDDGARGAGRRRKREPLREKRPTPVHGSADRPFKIENEDSVSVTPPPWFSQGKLSRV